MKHDYIEKVFTDLEDLKAEGIWFSGVEDEGEFKKWWDNGNLYVHHFSKNNKYYGEYRQWYEHGQLWFHCFFNKNGKKDGEAKKWLENGKLYSHELYKKGKIIKDYLK